ADHGGLRLLGDVVLDEHVVLEHGDLGAAGPLAHHHGALDGLAAGQELRLGDRVAAAARITALAAALPLGLQAGRPLDGLDLVPRLADLDHGVRRIVRRAGVVVAAAGAAPPPTPPRAGGAGGGVAAGVRAVPVRAGLGIVLRGLAVRLVVAVGAVVLTAAPTATATASATAPAPRSAVAGGAALAAAVVAGPVPVVAVVAVVPALRGGALAGVLGGALVAQRGAARTAPAAARAGAALLLRGVLVLRAVGVLGAGVVGAVLVGDRDAALRGRGLAQERAEGHLHRLATARAVLVLRILRRCTAGGGEGAQVVDDRVLVRHVLGAGVVRSVRGVLDDLVLDDRLDGGFVHGRFVLRGDHGGAGRGPGAAA